MKNKQHMDIFKNWSISALKIRNHFAINAEWFKLVTLVITSEYHSLTAKCTTPLLLLSASRLLAQTVTKTSHSIPTDNQTRQLLYRKPLLHDKISWRMEYFTNRCYLSQTITICSNKYNIPHTTVAPPLRPALAIWAGKWYWTKQSASPHIMLSDSFRPDKFSMITSNTCSTVQSQFENIH